MIALRCGAAGRSMPCHVGPTKRRSCFPTRQATGTVERWQPRQTRCATQGRSPATCLGRRRRSESRGLAGRCEGGWHRQRVFGPRPKVRCCVQRRCAPEPAQRAMLRQARHRFDRRPAYCRKSDRAAPLLAMKRSHSDGNSRLGCGSSGDPPGAPSVPTYSERRSARLSHSLEKEYVLNKRPVGPGPIGRSP